MSQTLKSCLNAGRWSVLGISRLPHAVLLQAFLHPDFFCCRLIYMDNINRAAITSDFLSVESIGALSGKRPRQEEQWGQDINQDINFPGSFPVMLLDTNFFLNRSSLCKSAFDEFWQTYIHSKTPIANKTKTKYSWCPLCIPSVSPGFRKSLFCSIFVFPHTFIHLSSCPATNSWKLLFPMCCSGAFVENQLAMYMDLLLGTLFCSVVLYVLLPIPYIRLCMSTKFVLLLNCFEYSRLFRTIWSLCILKWSLGNSCWNCIEIYICIYISYIFHIYIFRESAILIKLRIQMHECGVSVHLLDLFNFSQWCSVLLRDLVHLC